MKRCNVCGENKPLSEYSRNKDEYRRADCKACRRKQDREGRNKKPWIIHHDPMDWGGLEKGLRLSEREVANMLKFCSFTDGTVIYKKQKKFVVKKENGYPQHLLGRLHTYRLNGKGDGLRQES